jgi:hypothetical protein
MQSAPMQEKSISYEPSAINFHLQETSAREPAGRGPERMRAGEGTVAPASAMVRCLRR